MMQATFTKLDLYEAVLDAHACSALRGNISHQALSLAALGSGQYFQSIVAALMTLGGLHAPLAQTYAFLSTPSPADHAEMFLANGLRVPGWGNAFVKGREDPLWDRCREQIMEQDPGLGQKIEMVTSVLHAHGKRLYPNPSCYTAAAGMILGYDAASVGYLFLQGRLRMWTEEFQRLTGTR